MGGIDGASWGPDDTILFAERGVRTGLLRVSAAGGESEPLTMLEQGEIAHRWPHILPGGQSVLFTVVKGQGSGNMDIAALDLDSGARTLLVSGGSNPHSGPTGHLIYSVDGTLWAVGFDPDRLAVTGNPVPVLEGVVTQGTGAAQFSLSNDGTLVYVGGAAVGMTASELGWVDREGQMTPLVRGTGEYQSPRLSPDGRQIAVTIAADSIDIWLYDIERNSPTRLTEEGTNYYPVWTPDGTSVTFASDRSGSFNLYGKAADGSGDAETLLEKSTVLLPGSWSPDGTMLAFYESTNTDAGRDIWTLRRDGEASAVIATEFNERAPRLSPDGQWLAYVSDQSGEDGVYVQPFPDGGRVIPISTGGGTEPVWSRDGRELYFRDGDRLMVVEVEAGTAFTAGRPEVLFDGPYNVDPLGLGLPNYDAAPDGRFLMVRGGTGSAAQITVVLNWFEELKALVPVP